MSNVCAVSRTRQGMESTTILQYFLINSDKFSMGVPQPDVITRAGLSHF